MQDIKELKIQVENALESVRPYLHQDGGDVELVDIDENMVVSIRLLGNCHSCQISNMTMKAGIEEGIKKAVPQIKSVINVDEKMS